MEPSRRRVNKAPPKRNKPSPDWPTSDLGGRSIGFADNYANDVLPPPAAPSAHGGIRGDFPSSSSTPPPPAETPDPHFRGGVEMLSPPGSALLSVISLLAF